MIISNDSKIVADIGCEHKESIYSKSYYYSRQPLLHNWLYNLSYVHLSFEKYSYDYSNQQPQSQFYVLMNQRFLNFRVCFVSLSCWCCCNDDD